MNQHGVSPAHDDVLAKMDALMNKHHDALARGSVTEDIPVLTEIVDDVEALIPVLTEVVEPETMTFVVLEPDDPLPQEVKALPLSGDALFRLDRQIMEVVEKRLPSHIVAAVDKALPVILEEIAMQLETMVRDTVAKEISLQLPELLRQGQHGDVQE